MAGRIHWRKVLVTLLVGTGAIAASACTRVVTLPPAPPQAPAGAVGVPVHGSFDAVSCGTPLRCVAVGTAIERTTSGGVRWQTERVPGSLPNLVLDAVDCPTIENCLVAGEQTAAGSGVPHAVIYASHDAGRRWRSVPPPVDAVSIPAIACQSAQRCLAIANDGANYWSAITTDGGTVWQKQNTLPLGFGGVTAVTCTTELVCLVAGYVSASPGNGAGAIAITDDSGGTWSLAHLPPSTGILHDVDCVPVPVGICFAVGTRSTTTSDVAPAGGMVLESTDSGSTWSDDVQLPELGDPLGISCPGSGICALVGIAWAKASPPTPHAAIVATTDAGHAWASIPSRFVPTGVLAIDCATTSGCTAAGGDTLTMVSLPRPRPPGVRRGVRRQPEGGRASPSTALPRTRRGAA